MPQRKSGTERWGDKMVESEKNTEIKEKKLKEGKIKRRRILSCILAWSVCLCVYLVDGFGSALQVASLSFTRAPQ